VLCELGTNQVRMFLDQPADRLLKVIELEHLSGTATPRGMRAKPLAIVGNVSIPDVQFVQTDFLAGL
jgi:hypothetical protein